MKKSAGALITCNKKILMLLRDDRLDIPDPDCWQLIGGNLEKGEDPIETLLREIEEETNLQIQKKEVEEIGKIIVPGKKEYFLFWIKLSGDRAKEIRLGNEGQKVDFISTEELNKIKLGSNLSEYLRKYQKGLKRLVDKEILDKKALGFDENGIYRIRA